MDMRWTSSLTRLRVLNNKLTGHICRMLMISTSFSIVTNDDKWMEFCVIVQVADLHVGNSATIKGRKH